MTINDAADTVGPTICCDDVWNALEHASFAVLSHVSSAGEPRSSGIVYAIDDRRLFVVVAPDSWKARQIANGGSVSLTVPIRRGGLLSLLFPIPPATISFHARATVRPAASLDWTVLPQQLKALIPEARKTTATLLELSPEGRFVTYGIGVSLNEMRDPAASRAVVPVA
jgi:Pyridoxamine 5'-phosphate oxidase